MYLSSLEIRLVEKPTGRPVYELPRTDIVMWDRISLHDFGERDRDRCLIGSLAHDPGAIQTDTLRVVEATVDVRSRWELLLLPCGPEARRITKLMCRDKLIEAAHRADRG